MKKNKLSKSQQLVLDTLNEEEALTYDDISEITGLSYDGIRGRVSELKQLGYKIDRMRDGANTFLMYKPPSSYRRPLDIKSGISEKLKAIDDFYKITDFLDGVKNTKNKKTKFKDKVPTENEKTPVLLLSDLHFGELIHNREGLLIYDTEAAQMRMEYLGEQVLEHLKNNQNNHLYILGLGDFVDGDMIFKNHLFRVEKAAVEQVQDVVKSISAMIKMLVANGITVEMHNVRGNHGITNYKNIEEDNWDNVVYDMLALIFTDSEDVMIRNFRGEEGEVVINGRSIILSHGYNMGSQIKTASGLRAFRGICGKYGLDTGDIVVVGHLHEFGVESDQGKILVRNGSMADASEYAFKLNLFSVPMQTLMVLEDDVPYPILIPLELEG